MALYHGPCLQLGRSRSYELTWRVGPETGHRGVLQSTGDVQREQADIRANVKHNGAFRYGDAAPCTTQRGLAEIDYYNLVTLIQHVTLHSLMARGCRAL